MHEWIHEMFVGSCYVPHTLLASGIAAVSKAEVPACRQLTF